MRLLAADAATAAAVVPVRVGRIRGVRVKILQHPGDLLAPLSRVDAAPATAVGTTYLGTVIVATGGELLLDLTHKILELLVGHVVEAHQTARRRRRRSPPARPLGPLLLLLLLLLPIIIIASLPPPLLDRLLGGGLLLVLPHRRVEHGLELILVARVAAEARVVLVELLAPPAAVAEGIDALGVHGPLVEAAAWDEGGVCV